MIQALNTSILMVFILISLFFYKIGRQVPQKIMITSIFSNNFMFGIFLYKNASHFEINKN